MSEQPLYLGLELTALRGGSRTRGIGRVAQAYFEELSTRSDVQLLPYSFGEFPANNIKNQREWLHKLFDRWHLAWSYRGTKLDSLQIIDPMRTPPFFNKPTITMVHDLIPYLYRERYQSNLLSKYLYWRMKRQIRSSDMVVTPSRSTADDLKMMFNLDPGRIQPIYHGIDHSRFFPRDDSALELVLEEHGVRRPYFLMVADMRSNDPRKRLLEVIRAWDHDKVGEAQLVIVGQTGEYSRLLRENWTGRSDRLVFPGYVNDGELACFYTGAQCLLFPSAYEGFGFPVLEAMACGTIPVVRNVGSVKEIAGEQAVQLPREEYQEDVMDIVGEFLDESPDVRDECVEHAQTFKWDRALDELIELHRAISGKTEMKEVDESEEEPGPNVRTDGENPVESEQLESPAEKQTSDEQPEGTDDTEQDGQPEETDGASGEETSDKSPEEQEEQDSRPTDEQLEQRKQEILHGE